MCDQNDSLKYRRDWVFQFKIKLMHFASVVLFFGDFVVILRGGYGVIPTMLVSIPFCFGPIILACLLEDRALRKYRCRICRRHIGSDATAYYPDTICFTCPDCTIIWDTGRSTREPGDGGD